MTANEQASRLRQRILQQSEWFTRSVEVVVGRSGLLAGSLYERGKRCGKAGCRCNRGSLHRGMVLAVRQRGRSYWVSLAGLDKQELARLVNHWKQFRRARREMIRTFKDILATADRLGKLRQIEPGQLRRMAQK